MLIMQVSLKMLNVVNDADKSTFRFLWKGVFFWEAIQLSKSFYGCIRRLIFRKQYANYQQNV